MKQVITATLGLMSLLGLSSCDDISTFNETEEFYPYCYIVKGAHTIQVMGVDQLCVSEIEKTDWEIIAQVEMNFVGDQSLQLEGDGEYPIPMDNSGKNTIKMTILTNAEDLSEENDDEENDDWQSNTLTVVLKGFLQPYTYMGKEIQLECLTPLRMKVKVSIEEKMEDVFFEKGHIHYSLETYDGIVLAEKEIPYTVGTYEIYQK